ncbi:MAG: hypothetical protein IJ092_09235 [Atopobiaceae bacterium]|nr:hypothetical protein [Atopobiaceae bacterium]MBR1829547.1 hypothetical protein [Atopobiaceae bacterium]
MTTTTIDGKMSIQLPEGLEVMDKAEVQQAYAFDYDNVWGARDENRHVMLTCIWKESHELLVKLAGAEALAKRAEKALSKTYKASGYHLDGYFDTELAGRPAKGFSYGFTVGDIAQQAEVVVVTDGACSYTFYYYTRPECAAANQPLHDELFGSLSL